MEDQLWIYNAYDVFASYSTGIKFDYICIYVFLAIITLYYAKKLSNSNNTSWRRDAIIYSLIFSVIEGVRYLRGTDYLNYALYYKYGIYGYDVEFVYNIIQSLFHLINLPFWCLLIFYSFCWIWGLLILARHEGCKHIKYILPIAIVFALQGFECFVRQSFAFSFVFIFILYLLKKKYLKASLFALISLFIHSGSIVFIIIILGVYMLKNQLINSKIYTCVYLLSTFIYKAQLLTVVNAVLLIFPFLDDSLIGGYMANADRWFGDDAFREAYTRGLLSKIMIACFDVSIMVLSYSAIRKVPRSTSNSNITFYYNLFCITNIMLQLFYNYELLKRCFMTFYMFGAFLIVFILQYPPKNKYELLIRKYLILFTIIYYIKIILLSGNQLFVWDALGKYNFNL